MNVRACVAACVAALLPAVAGAQQITGLAAWTVGKVASTSNDQSYENNAFSQQYILGLDTALLDRRLMTVSTEGSFRTHALTLGTQQGGQKGDQRGTGYKIGVALFPQRSFPLTAQLLRGVVDESGQYPSSSVIRGGLPLAAGEIPPAFQTVNRSMNANWQLNAGRLPRVEINYASGRAETTGSVYYGAQQHEDFSAAAQKETPRTRHSLRYDRAALDNLVLSAYNQRTRNLDYEFSALLSARSRLRVHSGRRRMVSQFDLPAQIVDPAAGTYSPPSRGDSATQYVITGVTFDPASRLSLDAAGSLDRQEATAAATGARLIVGSARFDVGAGLSLNANGTYGDRRQIVNDSAIDVITSGGQAGANFRTGPRWLESSLVVSRGIGSNRTPEGLSGETGTWSGQASVSSTLGWVTISAGKDRSRARDQVLDFGNEDVRRDRASLQITPGRFSFTGSWEDLVVDRGRASTFATLWQRTGSASASYRVTNSTTLTANAGAFTNIGSYGTDTTRFWGGVLEAEPARALRVSMWVRRDETAATQALLDQLQTGFAWLALVEYQIRDFTVAAEHRNTLHDLRANPVDSRFQGRQTLIRISRKLFVPL